MRPTLMPMPLAMVEAGRLVRLVAVNAGRGLRSRLVAMGFMPGTELEVIRNNSHGPLIVAVRGCRVMLGRGMAQRMIVE